MVVTAGATVRAPPGPRAGRQPPPLGVVAVRRLTVLVLLLAGCSSSSPPTRKVATKLELNPPPPPAKEPEPPPPVAKVEPPPPDPAEVARKAEEAKRAEEVKRRKAREKEFAGLPSREQLAITVTTDAIAARGLDHLTSAELAVVCRFPRQFPSITQPDLERALAAFGDRKGAMEHLTDLGVTDEYQSLRVRAAFGVLSEDTCRAARAVAAEIARAGRDGISDRSKVFVARHPELFPKPRVAQKGEVSSHQ